MSFVWKPSKEVIQSSNIGKMMLKLGFENYQDFWSWSIDHKEDFWKATLQALDIRFAKPYKSILDLSHGAEHADWLPGSSFNIVDSCFKNPAEDKAIVLGNKSGMYGSITYGKLEAQVNRMANGLREHGLEPGDRIAIDMPMVKESVIIYLGALKAGVSVATIADSFASNEIQTRIEITRPTLVFTQDFIERAGKKLPHYEKLLAANPPQMIVVQTQEHWVPTRPQDHLFQDFLSDDQEFSSHKAQPKDEMTVLFSSGTTGQPKAIPWTHLTALKAAMDAYYHHDIQMGDCLCWPTNLGWMMGPWLIFAALINKGSIALYEEAPMDASFGKFVEQAEVSMLGVVPSIVRHWKASAAMEDYDWNSIKCFSSTGEASNPDEMEYLMRLGGGKPVIEYCGGTEIGGGYVTSTLVQDNIPSTFSSQALGSAFVLLNDEGQAADEGEIFLIPPALGTSQTLLNKDHHQVYFEGTPTWKGQSLRRHGDELIRLENGYYKAQGRSDDAMNLGGIKVSSIQLEELINALDFVKESAAIAVSPDGGGPSKLVVCLVENASRWTEDEKLQQIRLLVRQKLNPLFKVESIATLEKLPRTASGKVMRRNLRDQFKTS